MKPNGIVKTDLQIQRDVIEELKWDPALNASEIGVAVINGVVTLSGYVDTFREKRSAENAALRITGVKAVAEDIVVKLVAEDKKNDTDIAKAIINALDWHSAIQNEKIKIKVESGWVTLEGEVEWKYQKDAIKTTVESIYGVTGISDLIIVSPKVSVQDVKKKIKEALHRSATVDSERIQIEMVGNKVLLKGKVRSYAEKMDAEYAAWALPGVESVKNELEIEISVPVFVEE